MGLAPEKIEKAGNDTATRLRISAGRMLFTQKARTGLRVAKFAATMATDLGGRAGNFVLPILSFPGAGEPQISKLLHLNYRIQFMPIVIFQHVFPGSGFVEGCQPHQRRFLLAHFLQVFDKCSQLVRERCCEVHRINDHEIGKFTGVAPYNVLFVGIWVAVDTTIDHS